MCFKKKKEFASLTFNVPKIPLPPPPILPHSHSKKFATMHDILYQSEIHVNSGEQEITNKILEILVQYIKDYIEKNTLTSKSGPANSD